MNCIIDIVNPHKRKYVKYINRKDKYLNSYICTVEWDSLSTSDQATPNNEAKTIIEIIDINPITT